MATTLAREIGDFAAALDAASLPEGAHQVVRTGFTDCVGVMIAGRDEPVVRIAEQVYSAGRGSGGRSTICFGAGRNDAVTAATVNGTAAHALDYDDVAMRGHVSAVLVPAILAEAEELDASGAAMVTAYVAGYETWGELGARLPAPLHLKGWHPTAILGVMAAAAACASLRRLTPEQAGHAIGLAASQAAGLTANFGSSAKPLHVGRAAAAGLLSVRLATAGATAAGDVLESERGYLAAFSADGVADRQPSAPRLGKDWRILASRLNVKRYPVCYGIHRAVDAMLDLKKRHGFAGGDIARIEACIGRIQAAMLRVDRPQSPLEAKFSARFCLAAAAATGALGLEQVEGSFLARNDARALMDRVDIAVTDEADPGFPNYAPYDEVSVHLRDGHTLRSAQVRRPKGHAEAPLTAGELRGKFQDCVRGALDDAESDALFAALQGLGDLGSARELAAKAKGARRAQQTPRAIAGGKP